MQYVCRSCLLRLGQPWRIPARQRQLGKLVPRTTRRAIQTFGSPIGRGSQKFLDDHGRSSFDPVSATDRRYSTEGLVDSASDRASDVPVAPPSSFKSPFRKIAHSFRKSELDPEWVSHVQTSRLLNEDAETVAIDEAFDAEAEEGHGVSEQHGVSTSNVPGSQDSGAGRAQQAEADSWEQWAAHPALSRRDKNQFSFLRSKTLGRDVTPAIQEFNLWKKTFLQLSDLQRAEPTPTEVKMLSWLLIHENVDSMRAVLQSSLPEKTKRERDRLLLYVALRHVPERAPMVLEALLADTELPFYMVEDSLQFLATRLRQSKRDEQQAFAITLAELVVYICERDTKQHIRLSQNTLHSILQALPAERLAAWFNKLIENEHPLHAYTMLHFASRFARVPATKALTLDILRDLCDKDTLDINTPIGASLCTSILTFNGDDLLALDENQPSPAELFQCLLDLGLVPNVITYTAIIRDLCLKKELATALDVFEVMKQHGIEPDAYTYSVIINGCKLCGDFDTLCHFAVEARNSNKQDPHIWNDIIHATFLACLKEPRRKRGGPRRPRFMVWGPMNAIYTRFFDPQPLRPLIAAQLTEVRDWMGLQGYIPTKIKGAFVELPPLPPKDLWHPTSSTLCLMIMGFIRHLPKPYDVIVFYSHFRELLRQGHPTAELIVREQGSLIHDIVLRALLKWKGTLRVMLDIVRDMMRDVDPVAASSPSSPLNPPPSQKIKEWPQLLNAEASSLESTALVVGEEPPCNVSEGESSDMNNDSSGASMTDVEENTVNAKPEQARSPIRHPRPSVHTWSILLKAFMFNQLPGQAEQVLKLMQHHGVKPNLVTWNTLAASYAKLGKTKKAVEAMRRLEAAGFKSDDWTLRAFSYITDKNRAIKLMEQTVEQNRLTKMAMEQAQAEDEEARRQEQQQLIEDEIRERQSEREHSPREESKQHQDDMDALSDDVSREVYEEMVKIVENTAPAEKPEHDAWETALWDEAAEDQSQEGPTSGHDESRRSTGTNA